MGVVSLSSRFLVAARPSAAKRRKDFIFRRASFEAARNGNLVAEHSQSYALADEHFAALCAQSGDPLANAFRASDLKRCDPEPLRSVAVGLSTSDSATCDSLAARSLYESASELGVDV